MNSADGRQKSRRFSDDSGSVDEIVERKRSASKALQAYIEQFEVERAEQTPKTTPNGCYASRSVSSLLSSKPKAASFPRELENSPENSGDMVDNLISWVNQAYRKDLHRKIVPFGRGSSVSSNEQLRLSELEETDRNGDDDEGSAWSDPGMDLSTLPSPGSSVVSDIDSNVESVSTDILVRSFYKKTNTQPRKGSGNYPSWVDDLTTEKNYPTWIDDVDQTQINHHDSFNSKKHYERDRLSRSLSPSFFRRDADLNHPAPSFLSTSLQDYQHDKALKSHPTKNELWDLESTDTEVLVSQSIYGQRPVNMGGSFHRSLYQDVKIKQLHEESIRKIAKRYLISETKGKHVDPSRPKDKNIYFGHKQKKTVQSRSKVPSSSGKEIHSTLPLSSSSKTAKGGDFGRSVNASKNFQKRKKLELFLEERKESVDSSNTDRMMRQSPTGIHMVKRAVTIPKTEEHFSETVESWGKQIWYIKQTPPRATEELTRLIASTETPSSARDSPAKQRDFRESNSRKVSRSSGISRERLLLGNNEKIRNTEQKRTQKNYPRRNDPRLDFPRRNVSGIDVLRQNYPRVDAPRNNYSRVNSSTTYDSRRDVSESTDLWRHDASTNDMERHDLITNDRIRTNSRINASRRFASGRTESWRGESRNNSRIRRPRTSGSNSRFRTATVPDIVADRLKHVSLTDRRKGRMSSGSRRTIVSKKPAVNYSTNGLDLRGRPWEETDSLNTEALVIHPPMPLFDASPSLTTETASTVGSDQNPSTLVEHEALKTSLLFQDGELVSSSGTSYMELVRSRDQRSTPDEHDTRGSLERDSTGSRLKGIALKPGIITSFLEDCMRSSQESIDAQQSTSSTHDESTLTDVSERPVETLKKMLFTVQRLTQQGEEEEISDGDTLSENYETRSEPLTEAMLADAILNEVPRGSNSLSRAYYHLARLKKLVSASREVAGMK